MLKKEKHSKSFVFVVLVSNPYDVVREKRTLVRREIKDERINGFPFSSFIKVGEIYESPIYQFIPDDAITNQA